MNIDIKKIVLEVVNKVKEDPTLLQQFQESPARAVNTATGLNIPEETMNKVIAEVKTKVAAEGINQVANRLSGMGGLGGSLAGLASGLGNMLASSQTTQTTEQAKPEGKPEAKKEEAKNETKRVINHKK